MSNSLSRRERRLYKRLAQYTLSASPDFFAAVARRPYAELVDLRDALAAQLSMALSPALQPGELIIDAPPVKREVQFKVDVRLSGHGDLASVFARLSDISPVVRALATEQFDSFVKRVRIFVAPQRAEELQVTPLEITDALLALASDF